MIRNIRPILSTLLRNRTGAVLVALQVAIALAVLVNAVYIVKQRVELVNRSTGIDVDNIFVVVSAGFSSHYNSDATMRDDLAWLRGLPGVKAATTINNLPLSGGGSASEYNSQPDGKGRKSAVNYFDVDEQGISALGVELASGRDFRADEIIDRKPGSSESVPMGQTIISKSVAMALFGTGDAAGRVMYDNLGKPTTVIGVIEHMQGSWLNLDQVDRVALFPVRKADSTAVYVVRADPGQRDALMRRAEDYLSTSNPSRMISYVRTLNYFRDRSYLSDRNMAIFLVAVTVLLAGVTALGIFALATFNVNVRTRQIGTRRAVGARRRDIVHHFMVENWLVTTAGVLLGCALALAIGVALSRAYELPRLDLYFLVGGVLALWALGQLAAWQPARRAATISPSVATRTI